MDSRVTVITGGGSGIGLEVARSLLKKGPVVVADRNEAGLTEARALGCEAFQMDVRSTLEWRKLMDSVRRAHGRIDALIHNAGVAHIAPLRECSDEQLQAVLDTNLLSVLIGTREAWPLLVEGGGGCVVNVASVSALVGQDRAAAYAASKGGVVALTRAFAVELAPYGVRVNSVCPGSTLTPLLERHFTSLPDGRAAKKKLIARHPIGRLLTPVDIAPTIVHLTEPEAAAITGANFVVDGGLTATFDYGSSFAGGGPDGDS